MRGRRRIARRTTRFVKRLTDAPAEAVERAPAERRLVGGADRLARGGGGRVVRRAGVGRESRRRSRCADGVVGEALVRDRARPCRRRSKRASACSRRPDVRRDDVLTALADVGREARRGARRARRRARRQLRDHPPRDRDDHAAPVRRLGDRPHHPPQRPGQAGPRAVGALREAPTSVREPPISIVAPTPTLRGRGSRPARCIAPRSEARQHSGERGRSEAARLRAGEAGRASVVRRRDRQRGVDRARRHLGTAATCRLSKRRDSRSTRARTCSRSAPCCTRS